MALKHAILALLEKEERTGYEIKDSFDGPLEHMWSASFGGIYPALHRMKLDGLLTEEFIVQHGKPNKKVYRITDKGTAELTLWFHKPPLPETIKDEFLLKMYLMPDSDPFLVETLLTERKQRSEKKVEHFKKASTEPAHKKRSRFFIDYSLHRYISELQWITRAMQLLKTKTNEK